MHGWIKFGEQPAWKSEGAADVFHPPPVFPLLYHAGRTVRLTRHLLFDELWPNGSGEPIRQNYCRWHPIPILQTNRQAFPLLQQVVPFGRMSRFGFAWPMDLLMEVYMPGKYSDKKRDKIWKRVFGWYGAFACSDHFMSLTESDIEEAEFIVIHFADRMRVDYGLTPKTWNTTTVEACCTESLPREIAAGPEYFESVAPVLAAFFWFLEETGILISAGLLARRVEQLGTTVVENAANPDMWGPAKAILETAKEAGLDMNSREEIGLFMAHCNQQLDRQCSSGSVAVVGSDGSLVIGREQRSARNERSGVRGKPTRQKGKR